MITECGFMVSLKEDDGKVLLIPSGHIVVFAALGATHGVRWSVSADDSDTERVRMSMESITNAFSELAQPRNPHAKWLEFLTQSFE